MDKVAAADAKDQFGALLDRALSGERVAITRHGRVVAVLVPPRAVEATAGAGGVTEPEAARGLWQLPPKLQKRLRAAFAGVDLLSPLHTPEEAEAFVDAEARRLDGGAS